MAPEMGSRSSFAVGRSLEPGSVIERNGSGSPRRTPRIACPRGADLLCSSRMSEQPLLIGRAPGSHVASPAGDRPDWVGADPAKIDRALRHAVAKPSGG